MITKEYSLLHKESQALVKISERNDGIKTLTFEDHRNDAIPFLTYDLNEIAAFFLRPKADHSGTLHYPDFDREEFLPVAVVQSHAPFKSNVEISEVVLPDIKTLTVYMTDRSVNMPEVLRKRYIPSDLPSPSDNARFALIDDDAHCLSNNMFLFAEKVRLVGKVLHISDAIEDWPVPEQLWDKRNLKLAIVDFGQDTLANACELRGIEVGHARKP